MRAPYGFGLSQEDERTEAAALSVRGRRVLSTASAGDMALSLLALGAEQVVAVDVSAEQLRLGELKLAAACHLERDEAIRFLGFLPAPEAERRAALVKLLKLLPPAARTFWDVHREVALRGPIREGRYERYLRAARRVVLPVARSRFRRLIECRTLEEQREVFGRDFDGILLRSVFRVMFSPRLYRRRGVDAEALRHHESGESLGDKFFRRFRSMCVGSPARENHLLQFHLLGRVRDSAAVPAYLTARGRQTLRERAESVSFVQSSIDDALSRYPGGAFDAFHLSNLPDWVAEEQFEQLLHAIVDRCSRPARLAWRYLHREPCLSTAARRTLIIDANLGAGLQKSDRFPVYDIVVAEVAG